VRFRPFILSCVLLACGLVAACGNGKSASDETPTVAVEPAAPKAPARRTADARPEGTPRIVFLGDSLTAGLGLLESESYPSLIQARLDREGFHYEVINAGVSGDTSAGGLRRLEWSLEGNVQILLVALGANDGLRGLPTDELARNLTTIVEHATRRGLRVILAGMEAPPNNGPEYTAAFRTTYSDLAQTHHLPLVPFLLAGVAGDASLNQDDGIHPNARGARILADTVWEALRPLLRGSDAGTPAGAK
jgi:acyl-CoA thioesterase I